MVQAGTVPTHVVRSLQTVLARHTFTAEIIAVLLVQVDRVAQPSIDSHVLCANVVRTPASGAHTAANVLQPFWQT